MRHTRRQLLDLPEANIVVFAFLLNYPWEFLQTPLYEGMAGAPHWEAVKRCSVARDGTADCGARTATPS